MKKTMLPVEITTIKKDELSIKVIEKIKVFSQEMLNFYIENGVTDIDERFTSFMQAWDATDIETIFGV